MNDPINLFDPYGLDWLDNAANFSAGFGDSLSFGLTDWARGKLGINDGIDRCSGSYKGGGYTEVGLEVGLTLGSGALKVAARQASRSLVRAEARAATRGIAREGNILHHSNPLFGHPGGSATLFPTGGLPASIHSAAANLELLSHAEHVAAHQQLRAMERALSTAVNPLTTAARAGRNASGDCGCK